MDRSSKHFVVQGDSGSGLACVNQHRQWSVVGVMSSGGAQCGVSSSQALRFTKVSSSAEWIQQVMSLYEWSRDCWNIPVYIFGVWRYLFKPGALLQEKLQLKDMSYQSINAIQLLDR